MSSQGIKQLINLGLIAMIFLSSCTKNENNKKTTNIYNFSCNHIDIKEYCSVSTLLNDTISKWTQHNLKCWDGEQLNRSIEIDLLKVFDMPKNRFITAILARNIKYKEVAADGITFLYGAKIKNVWYFFAGAHIVLPRENYTKDINTPLSFAKLHEIAMREVFGGYLIEKKTKKNMGWWKNTFSPEYEYNYEINDHFFDELNTQLVPFSERKTNPNCPFSCRVIDNEKEYAECLLKKQALSIWNEECAFIKNDTYLYAPELPIGEKVISKINKGESFKVIEYIDNTEWVYVRVSAHNPNLGLIHRKEISKSKI